MVPQTQCYHKKRHVKVYKQCLLKPFNQLLKKLNCFVIFHAWFPRKKYKIVSFNDLNHFFLIYLTKMLLQKKAPVGINTSRRTITKPR